MAIYSAGYLSPIKNKLGNAVGRRWRNLNVLAVYRGTISNPRTTAQQKQRARFKTLSELARTFAPVVNISMNQSSAGTKRFPRALFMHLNNGAVTATSPSSVTIAYNKLQLSDGNMMCAAFGAANFSTPNSVRVDFDATNIESAYPNVDLMSLYARVIVYCPQAGYYVANGDDLSASGVTVTVPTNWNGLTVQVYAFCYVYSAEYPDYGLNIGDYSKTQYCGTGTIS